MKKLLAVAAVFFLSTCQARQPDRIASLPEAPPEVAASLEALPNTELLATSRNVNADLKISDAPVALKACSSITVSWVQVTYPITVCNPPNLARVERAVTSKPARAEATSSAPPKEYKLSALAQTKFANPFWCRQHSGPWIAEITEVESCSAGVPSRFDLVILGIGQNVHYSWYGSFNDIPSDIAVIGQPSVKRSSRFPCSHLSNCFAK